MTAGSDPPPGRARELGRLFEPYSSVVYFASEVDAFEAAGVTSWWMGYFASRAAPLGQVPPEVVTAVFYNFAPRMIRRAFPAVWSIISPERAGALRREVADRALRRTLGAAIDTPEVAEVAGLARGAIEGCDVAGRPLYAAHAALPWPEEPHLALWHACTLLREHRFDGHNIALAAAGLDGIASHVAMAARGRGSRDQILPIRGWTEEEWDAAERRLIDRGWLHPDGSFTDAGRAGRDAVEDTTNALAFEPIRRLGAGGLDRLRELMLPLIDRLRAGGAVLGRWPPPRLHRWDE